MDATLASLQFIRRTVTMSVSAVGSAPVMPMTNERAEGPGPDHDGDSDDRAIAPQPVQAAPAPGTGQVVNKTA